MIATTAADEYIPSRIDEVSASWLTTILSKHHPGVEVVSVQAGDFFGYKPNKIKISVSYNAAGQAAFLPTSLVAKGAFQNDSGQHALSDLDLGMELELQAYAELVPQLTGINTPRCFHVSFDPAAHKGMLVLEDLAPAGALFLKDAGSLD